MQQLSMYCAGTCQGTAHFAASQSCGGSRAVRTGMRGQTGSLSMASQAKRSHSSRLQQYHHCTPEPQNSTNAGRPAYLHVSLSLTLRLRRLPHSRQPSCMLHRCAGQLAQPQTCCVAQPSLSTTTGLPSHMVAGALDCRGPESGCRLLLLGAGRAQFLYRCWNRVDAMFCCALLATDGRGSRSLLAGMLSRAASCS